MTYSVTNPRSLGKLIRSARKAHGFTFRSLAQASGVAQSQISKLEQDQIAKANPAHLALLAEPLELSLRDLYAAAGYGTPSALEHLGDELETKLGQLSPDALVRLERYVEDLLTGGHRRASIQVSSDEPEN